MSKDEIDTMWQQAMKESIKEGALFTRYHFAKLVAEKALADPMREVQRLGQEIEQEPVAKYCCRLCFNKSGSLLLDRMILCSECGNKRCPKATNHELQCTNSNEPNQAGSIYNTPPQRTEPTCPECKAGVLYECVACSSNNYPPQRKPLSEEQIFACENSVPDEIVSDRDWCIHFARAIEAKIKENT